MDHQQAVIVWIVSIVSFAVGVCVGYYARPTPPPPPSDERDDEIADRTL